VPNNIVVNRDGASAALPLALHSLMTWLKKKKRPGSNNNVGQHKHNLLGLMTKEGSQPN